MKWLAWLISSKRCRIVSSQRKVFMTSPRVLSSHRFSPGTLKTRGMWAERSTFVKSKSKRMLTLFRHDHKTCSTVPTSSWVARRPTRDCSKLRIWINWLIRIIKRQPSTVWSWALQCMMLIWERLLSKVVPRAHRTLQSKLRVLVVMAISNKVLQRKHSTHSVVLWAKNNLRWTPGRKLSLVRKWVLGKAKLLKRIHLCRNFSNYPTIIHLSRRLMS